MLLYWTLGTTLPTQRSSSLSYAQEGDLSLHHTHSQSSSAESSLKCNAE